MAPRGWQHDRLRPFVADSSFAQGVLRGLDEQGYVVLPGIFKLEEAEAEYERMWGWVEKVSQGVRRGSPGSWQRPSSWQRRNGADPWPCAQRDMMQLYQAGWVFSEARERMAERVFEPLFGMRDLHCSKDGFTLQRPTAGDLNPPPNDHFDQGGALSGLQCIQGSVALTDQEHDDGCFLCWPGSHRYHADIMAWRGPKRGRQDWVMLSDVEKDWLQEQGISPLRVPVRKGDAILWRSDLAHKGAPPLGRRDGFRAVIYICMMPATLTPEEVYPEKRRAYEQLETGSHWPCKEEWFSPRKEPSFCLQPYFTRPPELTPRQRLLYGLDRYPSSSPSSPPPPGPPEACEQLFPVVRVARRSAEERGHGMWTSPARPSAESIRIERLGVVGDYNHYRTVRKHSTPSRAVSIVTVEALDSLKRDGFEIREGDLGENITLQAPEEALAKGVRLRAVATAGEPLELEITEPMVACPNLERLPALASLPPAARRAFPRACQGRRGWYARVIVGGDLLPGTLLALKSSFTVAAKAAAAAAARAGAGASGGKAAAGAAAAPAGSGGGRGRRRWARVPEPGPGSRGGG